MTRKCHVRFCSGGRGREAPAYHNLGALPIPNLGPEDTKITTSLFRGRLKTKKTPSTQPMTVPPV